MAESPANLHPAWRASVTENYYYFTRGERAVKWLDADFESLGFTAAQSKKLRPNALVGLAQEKPEEAIERMGELELNASVRQDLISTMLTSSRNDSEKIEALIARLGSEEDRKLAWDALKAREIGQAGDKAANPTD